MGIIKKLIEKRTKKQTNIQIDLDEEFLAINTSELNTKLRSENIIKLVGDNGNVEYFYMEHSPTTIILLLQTGTKELDCVFKQLTGKDLGREYKVKYPSTNVFHSDGYLIISDKYSTYLSVGIRGFERKVIDVLEENDIERNFGRKIVYRDLLKLYEEQKNKSNDNLNNI